MLPKAASNKPIGILDSGVGGLSVLRYIHQLLPAEDLIYFADQDHVPYGPRPEEQIRLFSREITQFLLDQGAKVIVVACNTASAAALSSLRMYYPTVPFIGMEPAVKPGTEQTNEGKIGILATEGTFGSQRYSTLIAQYAQGVVTYEDPCPGLVEQIEAGWLGNAQTESILEKCLKPMLDAGIDTIILGCTHYPFVLPLIRELVGPEINVIDPSPAVARQVGRILDSHSLRGKGVEPGEARAFTTADPQRFATISKELLGIPLPVKQVEWHGDTLLLSP